MDHRRPPGSDRGSLCLLHGDFPTARRHEVCWRHNLFGAILTLPGRQHHLKGTAETCSGRCRPDRAAVLLDDAPADKETEPHPRKMAIVHVTASMEAIEHVR